MQSNLGMIQHTVSETHQENATIAGIAKQGQKDSETLKALTHVATMYLPATLVATVFSSNLIQLQSDSGNMHKSHYAIAPQFWIYVVSTALLMILTLGCIRLLRILT
jgi:Mg2+ and Co2+ transporter CorA